MWNNNTKTNNKINPSSVTPRYPFLPEQNGFIFISNTEN